MFQEDPKDVLQKGMLATLIVSLFFHNLLNIFVVSFNLR